MGQYPISPGWRIMLADLKISTANVLRRASLPGDLLTRERSRVTDDEYFRLLQAVEDEAGDPLLPLHLGSMISAEAFDPPIFAAMCSPDLNTALRRISRHKRLVGPTTLHVEESGDSTRIELEWPTAPAQLPDALVLAELVFFVELSRIGTRSPVTPISVRAPEPPDHRQEYAEYFGVPVTEGETASVEFNSIDASRPFLTANEAMWNFFEPELRARLSEIESTASASERVRSALIELLPAGSSSVDSVAEKLGTSPRTLQRRLKAEGESYQGVLSSTRKDLADHYLARSEMSGAEISFLLGYEQPNSFYRAFLSWTGETPEAVRRHSSN